MIPIPTIPNWKPLGYWGSLSDDVILYLQSKKVMFAETYAPYYLASIGAHIANLGANVRPEDKMKFGGREGTYFYSKSGKPCDIRLHVCMLGPPGSGKCLFTNTPIPTKDGWKTMEQLMVGDVVIDSEGKFTSIIATSPIMFDHKCYEIEFSDGSKIIADAEHQWITTTERTTTTHKKYYNLQKQPTGINCNENYTENKKDLCFNRQYPQTIKTTEEIKNTITLNHFITKKDTIFYITKITEVPSVPVKCITVDSPTHCYLAGKTMIPTHNSFYLSHFTDPIIGFIANTHMPIRKYTDLTTAGLVGSAVAVGKKGQGMNIPGDAEIFKTGVFGFDELSGILSTREDYNVNMVNTVLQLLDEGQISKRTLYGDFSFRTYATVWGGTQPLRLNLSHGLARRFLILRFSPTPEDEKKLMDVQQDGLGIKHSTDEIDQIRKQINDIWEGFAVKECVFERHLHEFKRSLGISHIDSEWIDRLAIGWNVVTNYEAGDKELLVALHHHLEEMITNALNWRYSAIIDGSKADVVKLVNPDKEYTTTDLKRMCCKNLGISYKDMSAIINEMIDDGVFESIKTKTKKTSFKLVNATLLKELVQDEVSNEDVVFGK